MATSFDDFKGGLGKFTGPLMAVSLLVAGESKQKRVIPSAPV